MQQDGGSSPSDGATPPPRRLNSWGRHAPRPVRPPQHWWHDAAV